jgi:hypothetical protein
MNDSAQPSAGHEYRPRFPRFQNSNDLGQWCYRCEQWIPPAELDGPCPGEPVPRHEPDPEVWWDIAGAG